ncbi:MAG: hypothetical protein ABSD56_14175 [Bryobacteraceae bacterium]
MPDLATADSGGNTTTLLLGNGSGGFAAAATYASGAPSARIAATLHRETPRDSAVPFRMRWIRSSGRP